MNIFLPYENSIEESVKALDDVRLQKQLVEVYQLLTLALREKEEGREIKAGHYHHPVYLYYKRNTTFLVDYGYECCREYEHRFGKEHKLHMYFLIREQYSLGATYIPYYMEGSKGQPNYIRTTENVSELFQQKLIKKWENDKVKSKPPKWTNRDVPQFYQDFMKGEQK